MKVKIKRVYLLNLLEKASTVSGTASVTPLLKSFLLEVGEGGVSKRSDNRMFHVLRTDTALSVVAHTDSFEMVDDVAPYRVLVHGEKFLNLMRNLECEDVVLNIPDAFSIKIEADEFKANWIAYDSGQFPELPKCVDTKDMLKVKVGMFVNAVERVRHATSQDSVQSSFKQVFFTEEGCWASDGFTYQRVNFPVDLKLSLPIESLDVVKFAKLSGIEEMYIGVTKDLLYFVVGQDIFLSQSSKVKTPFIQLLTKLDKKNQGHFYVEVAQMRKLIKRIGITSEKGRVYFDVAATKLTVSGKDKLDNESNESFPIKFEGAQKAKKKFPVNWEFLDNALGAVRSKGVMMVVDNNHIIFQGDDCYGVVPMIKED